MCKDYIGTLLTSPLDVVIYELQEGCLQQVEEMQEEKGQYKIDSEVKKAQQFENSNLPVHCTIKLLIKTYSSLKKKTYSLDTKNVSK